MRLALRPNPRLLGTPLSALPHEFNCLLIRKAVPYSVTCANYEIVFPRFDWHLFNVWERRYLVLLRLLNISVRTRFGRWRLWLLGLVTGFLFLRSLLVELVLESWILVLPVSNGPGNSNDALDSAILYEAAALLNPLHLAIIVWLVVIGEFNQFPVFQT